MNNILQSFGLGSGKGTFAGRRPQVRRTQTDFGSVRTVGKAERFKMGMPPSIAAYKQKPVLTKAQIKEKKKAEKQKALEGRSFFYRHRIAFAAVAAILVLAIGLGIYASSLVNDKTMFLGDDHQQTGSAAIAKRISSTPEMSENVVYVLIVGVDASSYLTDCIWVMCYDIAKQNVNVLQIPRDTYVGDESYTGKINGVYQLPKTVKYCEKCEVQVEGSQLSGGRHTVCGTKAVSKKESNINGLIRNINEHLGLPIDHFILFDFEGFSTAIDTIGGVDVVLDKPLNAPEIQLTVGTNHLNGTRALQYMRHRSTYTMGDLGRVEAQRKLIDALLNKMLSLDLDDMLGLLTKCAEYFRTDLSVGEMIDYATTARGLSTQNFHMYAMPGYDHWVRPNPSYYCCNESETVALLNEHFLPYGLPGGGMADSSTVNFPEIVDKYSPENDVTQNQGTTTSGTTQSTTQSTTTQSTTTSKTTASTTTSKTTSTSATSSTTQSTTEKPVESTTKAPTESTTTTTKKPTEKPTTTTTIEATQTPRPDGEEFIG